MTRPGCVSYTFDRYTSHATRVRYEGGQELLFKATQLSVANSTISL